MTTREAMSLLHLQSRGFCKYIIQFSKAWFENENENFVLLMEYANGQNLREFRKNNHFNEEQLFMFIDNISKVTRPSRTNFCFL